MVATRFAQAAGVVAVVGSLLVIAGPIALAAPRPFLWSIVGTGLVALVFALYTAYGLVMTDRQRIAPAAVATAFGLWLVVAPLVYAASGIVVGVVQSGGVLLAAFAGYAAIDALES